MENFAIANVEGYGKTFLKMASGKIITLNNIRHIPEMRKNLISVGLLIENGFKCILIFYKVVN